MSSAAPSRTAETPPLSDLAAALLDAAKRAGADAADTLAIRSEALEVEASGGALETIERSEALEFGLRAMISDAEGWREATISASDPSPATLTALAERAVAMAREAPVNPNGGPPSPEERAAQPPVAIDALALTDPGAPPDPEALLDAAKALEAAALAVKGVRQADGASASAAHSERLLATSDGFSGRYEVSSFSRSVTALAGEGVGMQRDYAFAAGRRRSEMRDEKEIGREAGERVVRRLSPRSAKSGAFPVLFERRIAASLASGLLAALNGEQIARGASFLASRMGERILPEGVDLIDDPHRPGGLGTRPFDGEGFGGRRKRLIADGVVSEWLLDSGAARRLGLKSNGSAARGTSGAPLAAPSNAWIPAGDRSVESLIVEMGEGLVVTEMMGKGLDPVTGNYSRGAAGFWVEGGKIAYPVAELTIAGHILEMLNGLEVADDLRFEGRVNAPSLRMEGLTIGSA